MRPHETDPEEADELEDPERDSRLPAAEVAELLAPQPGTRCLDVGTGTGHFARPLAERLAPGRVVGLDRSRRMLAELRERTPEGDRVAGVRGVAERLPFRRASFSRALSVNVHHEIRDVDPFLDELVRVLEQGARLLVVDWAPVETDEGPPLEHRVPAETIVDQLERAGFEDVEAREAFPEHSAVLARRSTRP